MACIACAGPDVPRAENHAPTGQKTMRAVHHWEVLADDIAGRIADRTRTWPAGAHPIYVAARSDTRFNQGLRTLLILRLVDRGLTVSSDPSTPVRLVVDAQVVQHLQPASSVLHWVPLASGVSVARDGAHFHGANAYSAPVASGARPEALAVPVLAPDASPVPVPAPSAFGAILPPLPAAAVTVTGAPGATAANAVAPAPVGAAVRRAGPPAETPVVYPRPGVPARSEVLVIASLESGGRYLAGTSDVYSVAHDDALLYLAAEPLLPGPQPTPVKTWRVVAP